LITIRHHVSRQSGHFVHFFVQRDPFLQVLELNGAADLRQDREGVRIPLDHDLSERDLIALVDFQLGAVHHGVALALATFVVHHGDRALAIHHYQVARLGLHRLQPDKAHCAVALGV
jgi:hypothetical protein